MDLHTVDDIVQPRTEAGLPTWQPGDAPLAGGTWLFSEPQPGVRRLVDLAGLGWDELRVTPAGLRVGATCTLAALAGAALPWDGASRLARFCAAALASTSKVQASATVGGNLCLALPAGSFAAWAVALDGVCVIRTAHGERRLPAAAVVTGDRATVLAPGELLRAVDLPAASLARRVAFRRASLAPLGRSGALLVGTAGTDWSLTVTASTKRPVVVRCPSPPSPAALQAALRESLPDALLHDDVHGRPDWRRHMTFTLAEEIRAELAGQAAP